MIDMIIAAVAGICAGVLNGLNGNSAFGIVPPVLILFLRIEPYSAIGVSLATDVISSAVSVRSYFRGGHIQIKTVYPMVIAVIVGALIGSFISRNISSGKLGGSSGIFTIMIGISFLRRQPSPLFENMKKKILPESAYLRTLISALVCFLIGVICGITGFWGGRSILFTLMVVLSYSIHTALGSTILMLFFAAMSGAISHIQHGDFLWPVLIGSCTGSAFGAAISSRFAALTSEKKLMTITGFILIVLGSVAFIDQILGGGKP